MTGGELRLGSSALSMALRLSGIGLVRDVTILDGVGWEVAPHERWIVLGPNRSGKTTLMQPSAMRPGGLA
jgi:ABC-type molybdenum transport system ATPase subunit/photorepair protein PhrA